MPSNRRVRLLFLAVLATVVVILFYTSQARDRNNDDFYGRTLHALEGDSGVGGGGGDRTERAAARPPLSPQPPATASDRDKDGDVDAEDERLARDMAERLRASEQRAKDLANQKAPLRPDRPSDIIGVGSSAGGQIKKGSAGGETTDREPPAKDETPEDHDAEVELNAILKRAPGMEYLLSFWGLASLVSVWPRLICCSMLTPPSPHPLGLPAGS